MAFTKVTGPGIHTLANITSHNINSSGIITATKFVGPLEASSGSTGTFDSLTITGNVSVGGTLTYEDVTNIDSVGIITAQNGLRITAGGINVTAGISTFAGAIDANGALDVDGQTDLDVLNVAETATFSALVDVNNRIDIVGGANIDQVNVTGVTTFSSLVDVNNRIDVVGGVNADQVNVTGVSTFAGTIDANGALDVDGQTDLDVLNVAEAATFSDDVFVNVRGKKFKTSDWSIFNTTSGNALAISGGGSATEKIRITNAGDVGIGTDNPGGDLHIYDDSASARIYISSGNSDDSSIYFGRINDTATAAIRNDHSDNSLRLYGYNNSERLRITSDGHIVTQGLTSYSFNNDTSNAKILEVTGDGSVGEYGVINISGNQDANNSNIGNLRFINRQNSNSSSGNNAASKLIASIQAYSVTSDTNAGDDSGGILTFNTKGEAAVNNERFRITSAGRVLIATTDEGHGNADDLTIATAGGSLGHTGITIRSGTSSDGNIFFSDATSGGGETKGVIKYSHNTDHMQFNIDGSEALRITSAGNATFSGIATATNHNLSAISTTISDTAVNLFVYDTRKDSDGGAWRKRTSHTSWYNETLGSSTRGSRKEFPAVAVIVAEAAKVTIYDGDDPDLSMWMVFNQGSSDGQNRILNRFMGNLKSVSMLNGNLLIGGLSTSSADRGAGVWINFISEISYAFGSSDAQAENIYGFLFHTIAQRNTILGTDIYGDKDSKYQLANNSQCNDVAITVLPNAPIDASTGLPIPTIAVATDSGVSVIKDDGNVVDLKRTSDDDVHHVAFDDDRVLMYMELGAIYVAKIPDTDQSGNPNAAWSVYGTYSANTSGTNYPKIISNGSGAGLVSMKDDTFATSGQNTSGYDKHRGLSILDQNVSSSGNGMVAWIKKDFNSGWMHGDCKGAFLSDTDDTNITALILQAESHSTLDSTFATSNGWSHGSSWSISGGVATCDGGSDKFLYPNANTFTEGTSVAVEVTVTAYTSGTLNVSFDTGNAAAGTDMTATGTYYFVGECTGNQIVYIRSASFVGSIDNVKMYIAEADRSENNKGLAVVGTINKTAVATGAELVSYGNFSNSNYLTQPHNSDMQTGTGDFSVSCWFKTTGTDSSYEGLIFYNSAGSINDGFQLMMNNNGSDKGLYFYVYGASTDVNSDYVTGLNDGNWHFSVSTYTSSQIQMYVDGELKNTKAHSTGSIANSTAQLTIGRWFGNTSAAYHFRGDLALVRHSASVPSPEQVKKMYDDEKDLFVENAKCTLYGSSNAVTAVAFDDSNDNLHAGTSGGRSDFVGLNRINNTTTAVTTAISASNGLIIEQ